MTTVGDIAAYVRSKNAGPFWLTIDVFCGDPARFDHITSHLASDAVARALKAAEAELKRFDLPDLGVIKLSVPRPTVQGRREDRDMHGAAWAVLVAELEIPPIPEK